MSTPTIISSSTFLHIFSHHNHCCGGDVCDDQEDPWVHQGPGWGLQLPALCHEGGPPDPVGGAVNDLLCPNLWFSRFHHQRLRWSHSPLLLSPSPISHTMVLILGPPPSSSAPPYPPPTYTTSPTSASTLYPASTSASTFHTWLDYKYTFDFVNNNHHQPVKV